MASRRRSRSRNHTSRSKKHRSRSRSTGKVARCHSRRKKTLPVKKLRKIAKSHGVSLGKSKKKSSILAKLRTSGVSKNILKC